MRKRQSTTEGRPSEPRRLGFVGRGAVLALFVAVLFVQVAVQVHAIDPLETRGPGGPKSPGSPDAPESPALPEPAGHTDQGGLVPRGPAPESGDRPDAPGLASPRGGGQPPGEVPADPEAFAEDDGGPLPKQAPGRPASPANTDTATGPVDRRHAGGTCHEEPCGPNDQKHAAAASSGTTPQGRGGVIAAIPDEPLVRAVSTGAGVGVLAGLVIGWRSALAGAALRVMRGGKGQPESHPVRSAVLRHVELHPGATTRELAKAANVTYRRVVYHLDMLERGQRLRVRTVGRKRLHFAADAPRVDDESLALRALADPATSSGRILARLADQPGMSLTRIARTFDLSVGNTHYHVQRLREADLVRVVRRGTRIRHYVTTRGRAWTDRMAPLALVQAGPAVPPAWGPAGAGVPA